MDIIINSECRLFPDKFDPLLTEGEAELNALKCLGFDTINPPYAALLAQINQIQQPCLVLSPARWEASHNNVIMTCYGKALNLSDEESKHLYHLFAEHWAEANLQLHYHNAYTWLLSSETLPAIQAKPIQYLLGNPLFAELSVLDPTHYWQKFFTENQMLLASKASEACINGLWCWGEGSLMRQKKALCVDESYMPMAQVLSSNVTLYKPSSNLSDYQVILVNSLDVLSETHQAQLKKQKNHWYWNDQAYILKPKNWFTRLWGK